MNLTHSGKIGRLPREVRDQLNRRLDNGESGKSLVQWLNSLPEVQAVLAAEFGGIRVREQNLSRWRQGGYREWLLHQQVLDAARQLADDAQQLQPLTAAPLTDQIALWLAARYLVAARNLSQQDGQPDLKLLRDLCRDLVSLRRGDHYAERLRLDRERWAAARSQSLPTPQSALPSPHGLTG